MPRNFVGSAFSYDAIVNASMRPRQMPRNFLNDLVERFGAFQASMRPRQMPRNFRAHQAHIRSRADRFNEAAADAAEFSCSRGA